MTVPTLNSPEKNRYPSRGPGSPTKHHYSPWKISCRVAATFSGCLAAVMGVLSAGTNRHGDPQLQERARVVLTTVLLLRDYHFYPRECEVQST